MKNTLLFFLIFLTTSAIQGQSYFPDRCNGKWEGKMTVYYMGKEVSQVDVKMNISKIPDSLIWNWQTIYLAPDRTISKDYKLILEEPESNKFTLDENNGILLYGYVFENKMFSNFEVEGNLLTSVYLLEDDTLIFEITSGKNIGKTGEGISNFSIQNLQRSVLKRVID